MEQGIIDKSLVFGLVGVSVLLLENAGRLTPGVGRPTSIIKHHSSR